MDPGLLYRGAAGHHAGLAAATCGRVDLAGELLRAAVDVHVRHGSPWMADESRRALASLTARR